MENRPMRIAENNGSDNKTRKQLAAVALKFEEQVNAGLLQDGSTRFYQFAERYLHEYAEKNLKAKTYAEYKNRLVRINQAIGNIRLCDLRTGHINSFCANLQEEGVRLGGKYTAKVDIAAMMKSSIRT